MRILLTGATGYIGKRLLPVLAEQGHDLICVVRNASNFRLELQALGLKEVQVMEHDLLEPLPDDAPLEFDVAYYLIHSMSASIDAFEPLEEKTALNFRAWMDRSEAKQIIYLTGIVNNDKLSRHLQSRLRVEEILEKGRVPLTALRAGIIVGSGSASFEIIRDLTEKLPVMIAPKWVFTKIEPIAIRNVIEFLTAVLLQEDCLGKNFDIGCGQVLTYRDMLLDYAEVRGLWRKIIPVPVMTPRLSSYWLYFVTATTYELAVNLVNSMKLDVVARDHWLAERFGIDLISYKEAVSMAFEKIEQNMVVSSWKDSLVSSSRLSDLSAYIRVPQFGCFFDRKELLIQHNEPEQVWRNIMSIGGTRGWYYGNFLWKLRGLLDKMVGGIGLRRGRTNPDRIHPGDALDFWRVLVADEADKRLLLYAEMRLPGEAWLEFSLRQINGQWRIFQTATFRPFGIMGRLYWYLVLPFHFFVFNGMIRNIERFRPSGMEAASGKAF